MLRSLISTLSLATALTSVSITAALAMPSLRPNVTVASALVTVGDIFEEAGLAAEEPIFRAPAPGTTGVLTLAQVQAAAQSAGITEFDPMGLTSVSVSRAGAAIDLPLITRLIEADLRQRGIRNDNMNVEIALDAPLPAIVSANLENPASLVILRYMPGSSTFSARFQVAGRDAPLDVTGQIQIMIEAPHLARTLPAGTILGPNDVEMRMIPLGYAESSGVIDIDDIVGKQLQRQTREGVLIRPADIAAPELVSRNQLVTVIYRMGALTLTTRGRALNAASLSQPVTVLNPMTNKVLHGVASGTGTVTLSTGDAQLAGL